MLQDSRVKFVNLVLFIIDTFLSLSLSLCVCVCVFLCVREIKKQKKFTMIFYDARFTTVLSSNKSKKKLISLLLLFLKNFLLFFNGLITKLFCRNNENFYVKI